MGPSTFKEAITLSILETFKGGIIKFFFGSVGGAIAIFLLAKNALDVPLVKSIYYGLIVLFIVFLIRFGLRSLNNILMYLHNVRREIKYGEAIIFLKNAFAKVHSLRKKENPSSRQILETLIFVCDQLRELFNYKSINNYSVSIKVTGDSNINIGAMNARVYNLCRDSYSFERDTDRYKEIHHTIVGNSAFHDILVSATDPKISKHYYINGDIPKSIKSGIYKNTSIDAHYDKILPYKSELVVPIVPCDQEDANSFTLIGFLCVDCSSTNGFEEKYDSACIEGVADGIYDVLNSILLLKRENHAD